MNKYKVEVDSSKVVKGFFICKAENKACAAAKYLEKVTKELFKITDRQYRDRSNTEYNICNRDNINFEIRSKLVGANASDTFNTLRIYQL